MITCSECSTKYRPLTDAFKCPCCGASNWPDEQEDESPASSYIRQPGKKTTGRRVECGAEGWYKLEPGDYCKVPQGYFMSRVPEPCFHTGSLEGHEVVEHEDGTITVSPSILHTEPNIGQWHGFLERGIWRED